MKNNILLALKKGKLYDYIANNYHLISKEELKDVLLEVLWALYSASQTEEIFLKNQKEIATILSENWDVK